MRLICTNFYKEQQSNEKHSLPNFEAFAKFLFDFWDIAQLTNFTKNVEKAIFMKNRKQRLIGKVLLSFFFS